jgi:urocanate hydratase
MTHSYDEAIAWVKEAIAKKETLSVGLVSDAGDLLENY